MYPFVTDGLKSDQYILNERRWFLNFCDVKVKLKIFASFYENTCKFCKSFLKTSSESLFRRSDTRLWNNCSESRRWFRKSSEGREWNVHFRSFFLHPIRVKHCRKSTSSRNCDEASGTIFKISKCFHRRQLNLYIYIYLHQGSWPCMPSKSKSISWDSPFNEKVALIKLNLAFFNKVWK